MALNVTVSLPNGRTLSKPELFKYLDDLSPDMRNQRLEEARDNILGAQNAVGDSMEAIIEYIEKNTSYQEIRKS